MTPGSTSPTWTLDRGDHVGLLGQLLRGIAVNLTYFIGERFQRLKRAINVRRRRDKQIQHHAYRRPDPSIDRQIGEKSPVRIDIPAGDSHHRRRR